MPHLDEGTLNAWLDGELGAHTGDEGRAAAEHLERCSRCRVRLEAERHARERAASILASADLPIGEAPPLGSIRESEGDRRVPGRRMPRRGLAWAASIAVAVSAGLLARELSDRHGSGVPVIVEQQRRQVQPAPDAPEEGAQVKFADPRSRQEPPAEEMRREKSTAPERRADAVVSAEAETLSGRTGVETVEDVRHAAEGCWRVVSGQVPEGVPGSFRLSPDPVAGGENSLRVLALNGSGEQLSGGASWLPVSADSVSIVFPDFVGGVALADDGMIGTLWLRAVDETAAGPADSEGMRNLRLERTECLIP